MNDTIKYLIFKHEVVPMFTEFLVGSGSYNNENRTLQNIILFIGHMNERSVQKGNINDIKYVQLYEELYQSVTGIIHFKIVPG